MINDVTGKVILISVTVFIHLGILAVYWWEGKWDYYPLSWSYPYTIVVILMMCISSLMPFIRRSGIHMRLLAFRLVMAAVLAVPSSSDILGFGFIFALLIFEGFLYLPNVLALISAILCVSINILLAKLHISLWFKPVGAVDVGSLMVTFALYALCGAAGYYLAREQRLRAQAIKMLKELQDSNENLANININLQNLAADEKNKTLTMERSRMAREIHDTVAYTLTNLLSLLDAYREKLQANGQEVPEHIVQARNLVREGLGDVRNVVRGLRPGKNEGNNGLDSIRHLVEVFTRAAGIKVLLNYGDVPRFPGKAIEDVCYRVVQEGLTNSFRHGRATEVYVSFYREQTGIELTVRDNGQGSEMLAGSGYGLIGIGERVKALEGRVTTLTKPGLGFTLRVWIPFDQEGEEHGTIKISHSG